MKMYHCTSQTSAKVICEKGLIPNYSHEFKKLAIFLSDIPRHDFGCICFEVNTNQYNISKTVNGREYITQDTISPKDIKFYSYEEDE